MGEFPNKSTQFSSVNQPKKNGMIKGQMQSKTILNRFLSMTKEMNNPLNNQLEHLTYAELMHLKQIANALNGDLASYKEILDRFEGKVKNVEESTIEIKERQVIKWGDREIEV